MMISIDELFKAMKVNNSFEIPLSKFGKQLAIIHHESMQHASDFFNLSCMPPIEDKPFCSRNTDDASSSECHVIVKDVTKIVVRIKIEKVLHVMKECKGAWRTWTTLSSRMRISL